MSVFKKLSVWAIVATATALLVLSWASAALAEVDDGDGFDGDELLTLPLLLGVGVPAEGNRQHVDQGTTVPYRNRPPSSGDHYPTPAGYGVFTRDIPGGNLVHSLEHRAVVV